MTKEPSLNNGTRDLLAGMMSGASCKVVEYPFDTVKVLQQTLGSRYKGAADCLMTTYRGGGVKALYRGLTSPLLGAMAENSTLFVSYGVAKKFLHVDDTRATLADPVPVWKYLVAGASSGFCVAFVLTPVELVKCRLQVQAGFAAAGATVQGVPHNGPFDCALKILRNEGIHGLWRGTSATLVREIPGNVAWFGAYEIALKCIQHLGGYERKMDVPLGWSALAGSCAGVGYWAVPFPADTVKSKLQADPKFEGRPFFDVFRHVLRNEGVKGLYRGVGVTVVRAAPSNAILFFAYEACERWLRRF